MKEEYYLALAHKVIIAFPKYNFERVHKNHVECGVGDFRVNIDMDVLQVSISLPTCKIDRDYYRSKRKAYRLKRRVQHYINHIIKYM